MLALPPRPNPDPPPQAMALAGCTDLRAITPRLLLRARGATTLTPAGAGATDLCGGCVAPAAPLGAGTCCHGPPGPAGAALCGCRAARPPGSCHYSRL